MALTEQQDIPIKPVVKESWTLRRLFPFAGTSAALAKVFSSPFDILLGYLVFILGITELIGLSVSWMFWVFIILILFVALAQRNKPPTEIKKEDKKEDKK